MDSEYISICIFKYRCLPEVGSDYDRSIEFDKKYGLKYIGIDPSSPHNFYFKIVNTQKFLLAKLRYGI